MEQPSILASVFRKKMADTKDYSMTSEATEVTLYPTGFLNVDFLNGFKTQEMNPQTGMNDEYYAKTFAEIASKNNGLIATAHTASDNLETLIFPGHGGMTQLDHELININKY